MIDLTKMLQSAAKGKAPVVAIPIEGKAPVCLNRKRLAAWMKGVEIHSVELISQPDCWYFVPGKRLPGCRMDENKQLEYQQGPLDVSCDRIPGERKLKISGRVPSSAKDGLSIRTSCTMFVIRREAAALEIRNWAAKERERNLKVISQGAIGAAAMKAARKIEIAKLKAAKLAEIEKGGSPELEDANRHVANILNAAREHGRGPTQGVSKWEAERIAEQMPETVIRHVSHHAVPHRVRKTAAVIRWRLKALRTAWFEVTKYNPGRRKTTKKIFLKTKKSIQVIQIVTDAAALRAKLKSISPERIPNPRWAREEDMHWTAIDPLNRPKQDKREYYQHTYDRAALAQRLREARLTIKVLTPPPDNVLEMPEVEEELAKAA
jgi:hypothetical protein